ncbi:MAG: hypothetical protein JST92_20615 [Deltaproteobacteria bacterium]|nr:hypothetical protein [Deltaproteobacteria bacterium]
MATCVYEGKTCQVRIERDLTSNWAISVLSGEVDELSITRRAAAPLVIKVFAKTRWAALDMGLRSLKEQGRIASYEIEPRPEAELKAIEAEQARIGAKKPAG